MNKNDDKKFPYAKGFQYKDEHFNSFDGGRVADPVKEEKDTSLYFEGIGEQHYRYSQAGKRKPTKDYKLIEHTQLESEAGVKKSYKMHLQVKPNSLRYASWFKVLLLYIVVVLGIIGEFFIYQSIAENSFEMTLIKSYFIGFLVVLFTKFVQVVGIQKYIKKWILENNLRYRSIHKIMIFVFVGLILLNALMMGITNLQNIERQKNIEKLEYVSISLEEAEEYDEDTTELTAEYNELQASLNEDENLFFKIAKYISIALLGLLTIGAGASLFAMADLTKDALGLQKKNQKIKDRRAELEANFNYYFSTRDDLLSLQKEIIKLYGVKHFLEKLLSKEQEESLKFQTQQ